MNLEYKLYLENNDLRQSYGIEVIKNGKKVRNITGMGDDKGNLRKLVDLLNELDAPEYELDDIIEDYLTFFEV